jgi:hypothetical protein
VSAGAGGRARAPFILHLTAKFAGIRNMFGLHRRALMRSGHNAKRPRQDSNLRTRLRRAMLYPLSYEG